MDVSVTEIATLLPSDIVRFRTEPMDEGTKVGLLIGIKEFLANTRSDGGSGSDAIYMAAKKLSSANIWGDKITAEEVGLNLRDLPREKTKIFLEGLPHSFAAEVSYIILTSENREDYWEKLGDDYFDATNFDPEEEPHLLHSRFGGGYPSVVAKAIEMRWRSRYADAHVGRPQISMPFSQAYWVDLPRGKRIFVAINKDKSASILSGFEDDLEREPGVAQSFDLPRR